MVYWFFIFSIFHFPGCADIAHTHTHTSIAFPHSTSRETCHSSSSSSSFWAYGHTYDRPKVACSRKKKSTYRLYEVERPTKGFCFILDRSISKLFWADEQITAFFSRPLSFSLVDTRVTIKMRPKAYYFGKIQFFFIHFAAFRCLLISRFKFTKTLTVTWPQRRWSSPLGKKKHRHWTSHQSKSVRRK